jgi:hypothetical protein
MSQYTMGGMLLGAMMRYLVLMDILVGLAGRLTFVEYQQSQLVHFDKSMSKSIVKNLRS